MRRDRMPTTPALGGGWVTTSTGHRLYIQADAKTAPAVTLVADGARADVHNAFVLPVGPLDMGGACPSVTDACRDCYAAGTENQSPQLARNAAHNLATVRELYGHGRAYGRGRSQLVAALVDMVRHSERQQRARGIASPCFRWHSGGDLFAAWYARAIAETMRQTPEVEHWLYTRDAANARAMLPLPANARLYLSADSHNIGRMAKASARYGLPLAVLADDKAHGVSLWARAVALGAVGAPVACPATDKYKRDGFGPAHVVGVDGRRSSLEVGKPAIGACIACGVCLPGGAVRGVTFYVHGGKARGASGGRLGAVVERRRRLALAVAQ